MPDVSETKSTEAVGRRVGSVGEGLDFARAGAATQTGTPSSRFAGHFARAETICCQGSLRMQRGLVLPCHIRCDCITRRGRPNRHTHYREALKVS